MSTGEAPARRLARRRLPAGLGALPPAAASWVRFGLMVVALVAVGRFGGLAVLVVVLALIVIVVLHELGHFLTARWAGMKVSEFYVGFGPRLWSFRRGETTYGVKAILAGAYVRILGMNNLERVDPAEEHRTYRSKPYWRRMSVAVAGSAMHFLLAVLLLWVLYSAVGFHGSTGPTSPRLPAGRCRVWCPTAPRRKWACCRVTASPTWRAPRSRTSVRCAVRSPILRIVRPP